MNLMLALSLLACRETRDPAADTGAVVSEQDLTDTASPSGEDTAPPDAPGDTGGEAPPEETGDPGEAPTDADADGHPAEAEDGGRADCDDADPETWPGADERCDGADNDCDGFVDEGAVDALTWFRDADGDGWGDEELAVTGCEPPGGYTAAGGDCDDAHPGTWPGALEVCDGADNDCDGADDEDAVDAETWYLDADGDGWGDPGAPLAACEAPESYVPASAAADCDDAAPAVNPDATEVCDEIDNDCDGDTDEDDAADAATWYRDGDGDGFGDEHDALVSCDRPAGYVAGGSAFDCDDSALAVNPDSEEICNDGVDNDCSGGAGDCALSGTSAPAGADATLAGAGVGDGAGEGLAAAGDPDGDGDLDLLIYAGGDASIALVRAPHTGALDLGSAGVVLSSVEALESPGPGLAGIGDFDRDGSDDLLLGSPTQSYSGDFANAQGVAWLAMDGPEEDLALTSLSDGLYGETAFEYAGFSAAAVTASPGGGGADLLIGAPGYGDEAGVAYLVTAYSAGFGALIDADTRLLGSSAGDQAGWAVSGAGDVDGDGLADLLVGAPGHDGGAEDAGAAYLISGASAGGDLDLDRDAEARLEGETSAARAGWSVSAAWDYNGDGYDDVLVGAPYHRAVSGNLSRQGAAYLVLGPLSGELSLADADGVLTTSGDDDLTGWAVSSAGDVNGDGLYDVVVGAPGYDDASEDSGAAFLFYGQLGAVNLSDPDWALVGGAGDAVGRSLAGPLDIDGDGFDDLLVGAPGLDGDARDEGGALIFLGIGM